MVFNVIVLIIGILLLVDSLVVLLFPKWTLKTGKRWLKNIKSLKKIGFTELIVALVLILIGMNI